MSNLSRRALLAVGAGGIIGFAGCSMRIGTDETIDDERLRRLASTRPLTAPHHFPFRVTNDMFARHRGRTQELIRSVPASPDVPNQLVRNKIDSRRERLVRQLSERGELTPTVSGRHESDDRGEPEPPDRRLSELRKLRVEAANLQGTYRAATGAVTGNDVRQQRDRLRDRLAEFHAAWSYSGRGPLAAIHGNRELEALVSGVGQELEPWPLFPPSPAVDVDETGYIVQKLEAAAATMDDAEAFRRQQPTDGPDYRPAMTATATWLRRRARREAESVEQYRDNGLAAFNRELGDSVARDLFDVSVDTITRYTNGELIELTDQDRYAEAVIFAGIRRIAVTTFVGIVADLERDWDDNVSVTAIQDRRKRAREEIEAVRKAAPDALVEVFTPTYSAFRDGVEALERGNGRAALAWFEFTRRSATVAADVIDEVTFLLRSAAED